MTNPKPCPFCGGTTIIIKQAPNHRFFRAECDQCGATGPPGYAVPPHGAGDPTAWETLVRCHALDEWNRRASTEGDTP